MSGEYTTDSVILSTNAEERDGVLAGEWGIYYTLCYTLHQYRREGWSVSWRVGNILHTLLYSPPIQKRGMEC